MKTHQTINPHLYQTKTWRFVPLFNCLAVLAILLLSLGRAGAQINVLANPGAETGDFTGWTTYNNVGYNYGIKTSPTVPPHSGTYTFWFFGDYNSGGYTYNGMYQIASAHAGEVFSADGWVYQLPSDSFNNAGDGNNAFIEVTFQDINSTTLARYRSMSVTNGSPTGAWYDLQITNQYDPNTYAFLGTVTNLAACRT